MGHQAAGLKAAGAADVVVVTSDSYLRDSIGAARVLKASVLIRELDKVSVTCSSATCSSATCSSGT